ncbi:hypothetical protein D3C71_1432110 [compost metagenome]
MATTYRNIDDSDLDIFGKLFYKRSAKIICRCKACVATRKWCPGRIPLTVLPSQFGAIYCRQHMKPAVGDGVLRFELSMSLHIGLS